MNIQADRNDSRPGAAAPVDDDPVLRLIGILDECMGGLAEQLTLQLEDKIRGELGGEMLYIARERWIDKSSRDAEIRAHKAAGRSLGWLSLRYLLSRTQIRRILADGEPLP